MNGIKIQSSNILYLMICLLCILAFCLVGIIPNSLSMNESKEELEQLTQKVKTQELLYPIYRELIREATQESISKLPIPPKDRVVRGDINRINTMFTKLAQDNQVTFHRAVPDASSYLEDTGHLIMNAEFGGDFFKLRSLLLGICQLPYLERIEEMRIQTEKNSKRMSFKLQFMQSQ